ncbi:hypothetical protein DR64_8578 [Paraburkholderia xenovorans LB400]|nr:hypothetical protein DR64_8578 [Paraburkholderia xenovorans LB400]
MPLRSALLNQGKFEAQCSIAQRNNFAMLCGEAPCEACASAIIRSVGMSTANTATIILASDTAGSGTLIP